MASDNELSRLKRINDMRKRINEPSRKLNPVYQAEHTLHANWKKRQANAAEEAATDIKSRSEKGEWWAGIEYGHMNPVYLATDLKTKSNFAVNDKGIVWGHIGTARILIRWNELRSIEVGECSASKGTQHSAFGFGPIGVAFVAATAVHNASTRNVAQYRAIRISNIAGQSCDFVTPKSQTDVVKLLGPTADALDAHFGITEAEVTPASPASLLGVAGELEKLTELRDSGVLSKDEFEAQKAGLLAQ